VSLRERAPIVFLAGCISLGSVLAACHIFLDPDDLVTGAPVDGGPTPIGDASNSSSGASSGSAEWPGEVPSCVPEVPAGAALVAVVGGKPGSLASCPSGYEPTGQSGFDNVNDDQFECAQGSCACGACAASSTPPTCTNLALSFHSEATCKTPALDKQNIMTSTISCTRLTPRPGVTHAMVIGTIQPVNPAVPCPPSGAATATKQTPRVGLEVRICRPTAPAPANSACIGSDAPAAATKAAVACYVSPSSSCEKDWDAEYTLSTAPELTDTRTCECRCGVDPASASCTGELKPNPTFGTSGCTGGGTDVVGTCRPVADFGTTVRVSKNPTADPTAVKCLPSAAKGGGVSFSTPESLVLCCLGACGACRQAAVSPRGSCASTIKACVDDPSCKAYYECAQAQKCNSDSLGGAGGGCAACSDPPPSAATAALYQSIQTCRKNACPTDCR